MFSELAQPYNTLSQQLYAGYCPCERQAYREPWDEDYYDVFDYYGGKVRRRKRRSKRRKVKKLTKKMLLKLLRRRR